MPELKIEKNKNKTKKEKNKEKKVKNKKNLKKYKNKVDISRNQLRERNSLLIAKKNKLKSLVKSREDVKYSKDKTLKFKLSSQIHKLRNNIKRSEKKTDNLRKSISVEQNKLAKNQTRGLKSQFVRTKRRKEKVISDLEEVRHRWAKISPEVTRLMSVEKEIRGDILSLKREVSKENFIEKKVQIYKKIEKNIETINSPGVLEWLQETEESIPNPPKVVQEVQLNVPTVQAFVGGKKMTQLEPKVTATGDITELMGTLFGLFEKDSSIFPSSGTRQVSSVNTVSTEQVVKPVETKVRAEPEKPVIPSGCPKYGYPYAQGKGPHVFIRGRCTYCELIQ
jgi:hypothetical protein